MRRLILTLSLSLAGLSVHAGLAEDYSLLKEAFRTRNLAQLADVAPRLQEGPLAIYAEFWPLAVELDQADENRLKAFLRDYPTEWQSDRVRLAYAKRLAASNRWDEFRKESEQVIESDRELNCYRLQQRLTTGDDKAPQDIKTLWFTGTPLPEACNPLFDALFAKQQLTRENVWQRIQLALDANQYSLARYLNRIFPAGEGFDERQLTDAINRPEALLEKQAGQLINLAQKEMALAAINRIAKNDPNRAASWLQALRPELNARQLAAGFGRIGFHAARRHDPEALGWYAQADLSKLSDEEREWLVRAALLANRWEQVTSAIQSMSPAKQQESTWRYWLARAYKVDGKALEANRLLAPLSLEHNFYGLLARDEFGSVIDAAINIYHATEDDISAVARVPGIDRALTLLRIGARDEALREWNWAMRRLSDRELIAAAELARRNNWYDRAIYAAERTKNLHDFSLRYLTPYRDVTRTYAAQMGLDEAWVYGLIRQESRFVNVARSGVGASGLMQLMPATASWVARKLGLKSYTPASVNEVGTNVQLGTYYLRHVLDQLGNQPILATAAYNAGPGRARNWQTSTRLEGAVYAENIPFTETRDYVKKVMSNAQYYAWTFGDPKKTFKERLGVIPERP